MKKKKVKKLGLAEWEATFYENIDDAKDWSDKKCFEHTLKKYSGLPKTVLKQYGLHKDMGTIHPLNEDRPSFTFTIATCALCKKYYKSRAKIPCKKCPLYRDGNGCESGNSSWRAMVLSDKHTPMLQAMRKMIKQCDTLGNWQGDSDD